ncbi:MAG: acetyl-CoA carboxylase biotin carboxyl carrier protein subunit [Acidobacteriota bacterium]|jgi:pyruvate carboxylase|nr:acetyl-CoA carboxylase biotin carboxyl carrier protein subunit [Acidobacteriota bacterium]
MSEKGKYDRLALENGVYETRLTAKYAARKPYEQKDPRMVKALIPGVVAEVSVAAGSQVKQGETLLVLEAMKMLNRIASPMDGKIKIVHTAAGEKVTKGQVLIELY